MSERRESLALMLLALYIGNNILHSLSWWGMEFIRHYTNPYWASSRGSWPI
jgi:hypothetical protein